MRRSQWGPEITEAEKQRTHVAQTSSSPPIPTITLVSPNKQSGSLEDSGLVRE